MAKILAADDSLSIRNMIEFTMEETSHELETAEDGLEALELIENNSFDLIISDINMPNLGGVEFLSNIRISGFFQDIPVVIVSGEEEGEIIEKCLEIGINGYMKKPFNPNDLQSKILTILKNKKAIKI